MRRDGLRAQIRLDMLPAVDVQFRAIHVAGTVRAQKVNGLGHFLGLAQARWGNIGHQLLVPGERIEVSISPGEMALTRTP